jgi:hypothetical protein
VISALPAEAVAVTLTPTLTAQLLPAQVSTGAYWPGPPLTTV